MATLVCVPIMVEEGDSALSDASAARAGGADLVEFRLDHAFAGDGDAAGGALALRLAAESPLPCIMTCRPVTEGGDYDGDEAGRVSLFERLGAAHPPPRYLDAELSAMDRSANLRLKVRLAVSDGAHPTRPSLILSLHDFSGRPADLSRRMVRMMSEPAARVLKIAYRCRSVRDALEILDLPAQADRPVIALGMGDEGLATRVLAPKFGGFLTFASLRRESATAPGQPTLADLFDRYRFRSIGPATAVYGVIGWPVGRSQSPAVHNAGFAAAGVDAVYLPLPVAPGYESFKATLLELVHHPRLGLRGVSVTMPHKEHLWRLAVEQGWSGDEVSAAAGAANTLTVRRAGSGGADHAAVANTDGPAIVAALGQRLDGIDGRVVAVVGAGGVGRAAAAALALGGASVVIASRSAERASALASELARHARPGRSIVAAGLADLRADGLDAILNATPVGMASGPSPGGTPIETTAIRGLRDGGVIADTVYDPPTTPLVAAAAVAGRPVVDGLEIFVRQAEAQFLFWTGRPPASGLFDRVARRAPDHATGPDPDEAPGRADAAGNEP